MLFLSYFNIAADNTDPLDTKPELLFMEGRIVQKLECRPYADNCYMNMKLQSIKKASMPVRQVKQLDRVVQNFKPVSDHKANVSFHNRIQNAYTVYLIYLLKPLESWFLRIYIIFYKNWFQILQFEVDFCNLLYGQKVKIIFGLVKTVYCNQFHNLICCLFTLCT